MLLLNVKSSRKPKLYRVKNGGFTLVELMVAMTLLLIILVAITPLFVGSISRINFAGEKGEAVYRGQSDLELSIAEKTSLDGTTLEFLFSRPDDEDIIVEVSGSMVDAVHEYGSTEAWLSTFIPFVPTISLYPSPYYLVEGYDPLDLYIVGRDTNLVNGQEVRIYREAPLLENIVQYSTFNIQEEVPEGYDQIGYFEIEAGLLNAEEPYIVEMSWAIDEAEEVQVIVRTRLRVLLPYSAAGGDAGKIVISPDVESTWNEREHGLTSAAVNDLVYVNYSYIAVTDDGDVILWKNLNEPLLVNIDALSAGQALHSLADGSGRLVSVGENGAVVTSVDGGETWTVVNHGLTTDNLNGVAWSDLTLSFLAVGDNGTIMKSDNGLDWVLIENWEERLTSESLIATEDVPVIDFYGVDYGLNSWAIAGQQRLGDGSTKGVILLGTGDFASLTVNYLGSGESAMYDVVFNGYRFIAAGNRNSNIMSLTASDSGWEPLYTNNDEHVFYGIAHYIASDLEYFVAVGSTSASSGQSVILVGSEEEITEGSYQWSFEKITGTISGRLKGVALIW